MRSPKKSKSNGKQQRRIRKTASYAGATGSDELYRGAVAHSASTWISGSMLPGRVLPRLIQDIQDALLDTLPVISHTIILRADVSRLDISRRIVFYAYPNTYHVYIAARHPNKCYVRVRNEVERFNIEGPAPSTVGHITNFVNVLRNALNFYINSGAVNIVYEETSCTTTNNCIGAFFAPIEIYFNDMVTISPTDFFRTCWEFYHRELTLHT